MPFYDLGKKREYVVTAERAVGHALPVGAIVHHVDRNRRNGRNDNLVVLQSVQEHNALHQRLRIKQAGGDPWTQRICCTCKRVLDLSMFGASRDRASGRVNYCRSCATARSTAVYNRKTGRPDGWKETPEMRSERGRIAAQTRWSKAG